MESNEETFYRSNRFGEGSQPVILISQLMQRAASMQHMDELLQWLANSIVQSIGVCAVQIWTLQAYTSGQSHTELRAIGQSLPLPRQIYISPSIADVIARVFLRKQGVMPMSVTNVFPPLLANNFVQVDLSYWTCFFLSKSDLLPPMQGEQTPEKISTPLNMAVSLFTQQPLPQGDLRAVSFLLDQSLRIAKSRDLFSVTPEEKAAKQTTDSKLLSLVPHRIQEMVVQQEINPFANAPVIPEKKARRLYAAIDGKKSVAELALQARLDQQEMVEALQYLLQQERIQLYEPGGNLVESSLFFRSL